MDIFIAFSIVHYHNILFNTPWFQRHLSGVQAVIFACVIVVNSFAIMVSCWVFVGFQIQNKSFTSCGMCSGIIQTLSDLMGRGDNRQRAALRSGQRAPPKLVHAGQGGPNPKAYLIYSMRGIKNASRNRTIINRMIQLKISSQNPMLQYLPCSLSLASLHQIRQHHKGQQ